MGCHIRYGCKKEYLVDNLEHTNGVYKWVKYRNIPLEHLKNELYSGKYDNVKRQTTIRLRNKRIKEYILKRIEEEETEKDTTVDIGYIDLS
jgi:protein involved in temperature-dependent protein secretion